MSGFQVNVGSVTTDATILTGNTVTDIIEADLGTMTVTHIDIANQTGVAVTVTIDRYDGTTAWRLCYQKSVPANDTIQISGTVVQNGQKLRATSGDASGNLHIHVHHTLGTKAGGG